MDTATADAAVDRTMVLRRGGESLVTIDGRRAASRLVVVSRDVLILGLEDDGIVLPVGRTNALQLVAAATSTADRILREIMLVNCVQYYGIIIMTVVSWLGARMQRRMKEVASEFSRGPPLPPGERGDERE